MLEARPTSHLAPGAGRSSPEDCVSLRTAGETLQTTRVLPLRTLHLAASSRAYFPTSSWSASQPLREPQTSSSSVDGR